VNRREWLSKTVPLATLALAAPGLVHAQAFPARPIVLLVGGAPGSVPDLMVRPIAERLSSLLGQPVVVENKPGAAGGLAMAALARSTPDGHTLALGTMSQLVFNALLFARLPYDPERDLEPVAPLVTGAMALAAHPSFPARSLPEFVALAKAQPGRLFMAMPQLGSPPHIVALLLHRAAGIDVTMVPHKSGSEAVAAVVSGEIALLIDAPTIISAQVRAGKLKVLAVTGRQREPVLPGAPTAAESGLAVDGEAWIGLVGPAGMPPAVVQQLNRALTGIMTTPDMRERMALLGFRTLSSTADEFRAVIRADSARWGEVIRGAGLKLE
jgi:tripartite-type tricarboxylate transporter receptor subunit TctC